MSNTSKILGPHSFFGPTIAPQKSFYFFDVEHSNPRFAHASFCIWQNDMFRVFPQQLSVSHEIQQITREKCMIYSLRYGGRSARMPYVYPMELPRKMRINAQTRIRGLSRNKMKLVLLLSRGFLLSLYNSGIQRCPARKKQLGC